MNEFSCRSIADNEKTQWFGALEEPERIGFYERRWWNALRYWDGKFWRKGGPKGYIVFPQEWRGIKTPNALAQADAACGVSPGAMGSAAAGPERE